MEWKDISGWSRYSVSSEGQVRNNSTGRVLKPHYNIQGYANIKLCNNTVEKTYLLHRLVCTAFHPPVLDNCVVDHINGVPGDNRASNLRWTDPKGNAANRRRPRPTWRRWFRQFCKGLKEARG